MAKQPKKNQRKKAQEAKIKAAPPEPIVTRRNVLKIARNGAIGVAALGVVGYVGYGWYQEFVEEHDLTRLGQGMPAVVQVHDPQCPVCIALQGETRDAMKQFGEEDMLFLVADIKQEKGAAFAAKHNVPHVTLILMDGAGEVTQVLRGLRESEELSTILAVHFETHGGKG